VIFILISVVVIYGQCPPKLGSCFIFPPDSEWNRPITDDPVDFRSECFISQLQTEGTNLRLDMGTIDYPYYGIPFNLVDSAPLTQIFFGTSGHGDFESYPDESDCFDENGDFFQGCENIDPTFFPMPLDAVIEGDGDPDNPGNVEGDRHMIVIDQSNCFLYETYNTDRGTNTFSVASSAAYDLSSNLPQRPEGWTSADAAGLPILPGLLRYEDIEAGEIKHAIRFTTENAAQAFVSPAAHYGPDYNTNFNMLYYGARLRLRADFSETGYSEQSVMLIQALKKYGMIFADQGSSFYLSGTVSDFWTDQFF